MVDALFTLAAGLERATRQSKGAGTLSLLQLVASHEHLRPSEIAALQHVHPSLITRQVTALEDAGYLEVTADPGDGRSCLVTLTSAGSEELLRLSDVGLDRFTLFVADWQPAEVRMLTVLLRKLANSKAAVAAQERPRGGRRWARKREPDQSSLARSGGLSSQAG
jgi:DNA-binding MarR family transcriptional regulator